MSLAQITYEILRALLKLAGKRGVIMEYQAWLDVLNHRAAEEPQNPMAKGYLLKQIARINEEQMMKNDVLKTYDPDKATKVQTLAKIEEIKAALNRYHALRGSTR